MGQCLRNALSVTGIFDLLARNGPAAFAFLDWPLDGAACSEVAF
jgi:hypothetical protein